MRLPPFLEKIDDLIRLSRRIIALHVIAEAAVLFCRPGDKRITIHVLINLVIEPKRGRRKIAYFESKGKGSFLSVSFSFFDFLINVSFFLFGLAANFHRVNRINLSRYKISSLCFNPKTSLKFQSKHICLQIR
jgi:hypothetical protein